MASSVGSTTESRSASRASGVLPDRRSVTPALSSSGVPVKKVRAPSTAATARIPKARPPVPRVPSNYMAKTASSSDKEKENEMDQLVSRVQRVKLNMPSKEEYDAREKAKEAEKKPKTTRKAPTIKTTKPPMKRPPGRPPKVLKTTTPEQPVIPTSVSTTEEPKVEIVAKTPLEQPKPIVPDATSGLIQSPNDAAVSRELNSTISPRQSIGTIQPPTELMEMSITPEQLPIPPFVDIPTEPLPVISPPPREDTPPPPPPSSIPSFINTTSHTFGTATPLSNAHGQAMKQWNPFGNSAPESAPAPVAAPLPVPATDPSPAIAATHPPQPTFSAGTRASLPVFTASGNIPFAPRPNGVLSVPQAPKPKTDAAEENLWEVPVTPAR